MGRILRFPSNTPKTRFGILERLNPNAVGQKDSCCDKQNLIQNEYHKNFNDLKLFNTLLFRHVAANGLAGVVGEWGF
jgi:hypothetical protein